jgi:zinc protease
MKRTILFFGLTLLCFLASFPQERFRKSPPFPDPLQPLQLPALESARLSNGLALAVAYQKEVPFISLELVIQTGETSSPETLPGLATFTAEMLSRGTPLVSASEMEERIEAIGGSFSVTTSLDYSRFSFLFLDEYLDQALELLSLMVLQPAFSDREIVALRRAKFNELRQNKRDPDFVGRRQLLRILFQNHPCQKSLYNEDVFKNINRGAIVDFYETYYRPNNAILVLAGNLNLNIAVRKVSHYLNTWRKKDLVRPFPPPPAPNDAEKVCFVDVPQAKDATLIIGNVIFPVADPDFFPFAVLNQVLGGAPHSRLFMNLRESKEYAYFAFSETEFHRSCGVYYVRARVIPTACYAAVQEILMELGRAAKQNVSTSELEQAKSYLIGNFPLQIDRLDSLTRKISEIETYSLGDAYWNQFYENIIMVDAARVFAVGEKYLLPKPVVVIVGDKNNLSDRLRDFDRVEFYDTDGVYRYAVTKGVEE